MKSWLVLVAAASIACSSDGGRNARSQDAGEAGGSFGGAGNAAGRGGGSAGGGGAGGAAAGQGGGLAGRGGAAGTLADAGADAAPVMDPVPELRGSRYEITLGDLLFGLDASKGGRIDTLALGGFNLLIGSEVDGINWGSTLWTSPQSAWTWPPPAEIDSGQYRGQIVGSEVTVASEPSARAGGVSVLKLVRVDAATNAILLEYGLIAQGEALEVAPWEVTRVRPGGLSFFALGPGGRRELQRDDVLPVIEREGVAWFDMPSTTITKSVKLFADGKGWLAHVDRSSRILFIKTFADVPTSAFAPGEAEIELYVDGQKRYVELEQQGPYAKLARGARSSWSVAWKLRRLPANVPIEVGSAALLEALRAELP